MEETDNSVKDTYNSMLDFAKKLQEHLGIPALPKELIDDRVNGVDSEKRTDEETLIAHFKEDSLSSIKTVRFLKDFGAYKAVPDLNTTNTSFLRTAEVFRLQGIKNYYFLLQLNNPALVGVDPFSDDLTDSQRAMILKESSENFWYFLREVCRLKKDSPFLANRANISFIWAYLNHITTYMIMPRQQGKYQPNSSLVCVRDVNRGNKFKDNWRPIGDLQIGDTIVSRHGTDSTVIGIHPGGNKRVYKVELSDGRTTFAGGEHLWTVYEANGGLNGNSIEVDKTTGNLISDLEKGIVNELPMVTAIDFGKDVKHSYFMGLLFSRLNKNNEIDLSGFSVSAIDNICKDLPNYVERNGNKLVGKQNSISKLSLKYGLPDNYINSSLKSRRELLQAFLDLGHSNGKGIVIDTLERVLESQLEYLVRSLGGTSTKDGEFLVVTLPETETYFKYKDAVVDTSGFVNKVFVKSITFDRYEEVTCIEVDNEEQLYVTDNFIVTHNTVSVQVINYWLTYLVGRGYKSHVITLKSTNRLQLVDAVKRIRSSIPQYLVNQTYRDKDAGTFLTYQAFGTDSVNSLTISVPQNGEDAAGDVGRGLTVGTTNIDEPSYINHIKAIIDGAGPSTMTEMENMRKAKLPYGINYITTPNTTMHSSGEYMYKRLMSATEWREKFFDSYSESHLKDRLLKASPVKTTSPSIGMVYNYLQLGKDKDWVSRTIDELGLSLSKAKIDLLLMWVEDGEDRLFDDVTREAINNVKRDKIWSKEYVGSGLFVDFFVTMEELQRMCQADYNDFFLIGVDTSSAINKDACTLIIRSIRTGKVVGVGRYQLSFLDDVTAIIVDMLVCFKNSMLIIERNYAHHMIDNLLVTLPAKGLDPFVKIFNKIYQDPIKYDKDYEAIKNTRFNYRDKNFYLRFKQYFGFNTNSETRATLYGLLQEAVGQTGYGLNYDKLADELINLRIKGDRIDHSNKNHDDLVIAWLLTYWFIKLGNNKSLYNIPPGISLTDTKNLLNVGKEKEEIKDQSMNIFVEKVKKEINALTEEFMTTRDGLLAIRLESEIRRMSSLLPPETVKLITIDDVIENARIERNKRAFDKVA